MIRSHRTIIKRSLAQPTSNAKNKLLPAKAPENSTHHDQRATVHPRSPTLEVKSSIFLDTATRTLISTGPARLKSHRIRSLPGPDKSISTSQAGLVSHTGAEQPAPPTTSRKLFAALPRDLFENPAAVGDTSEVDPSDLRGLFIGKVRQRIANAKYYPRIARRRGMEGQPVIAFTLSKSGRLMKADLARTSGYQLLDQAALEAVHEAAPYPQIPAELKIDTFQFKLPISFVLK